MQVIRFPFTSVILLPKLVSTGATTPKWIEYNTPSNGSDATYTFNEWKSNSKTYTLSGASNAARVIFYGNGNYSASDALCLDNVKVWYYDESVDYEDKLNPDIEINDVWEDEEKGTLLMVADFDVNNNKKAVTEDALDTMIGYLADVGNPVTDLGRVNPDLDPAVTSLYNMSFRYASKVGLGEEDGNQFVVVNSSGSYYMSLYIGNVFTEPGTYTVDFKYKYAPSADSTATFSFIERKTPSGDPILADALGEWVDVSFTYEVTAASEIRYSFTSSGSSDLFLTSDAFYMDDIKIYKANEEETPDDGGDDEEDSEWEDAEKGTLLYEVDFETKNDGSAVASSDISTITSGRLDGSATAGVAVSGVGRVNPAYSNKEFRIGLKDAGTASLSSGSLTATTATAMSLYFRNSYVGAGQYTFVFDYNTASGASFNVHSGYTSGTLESKEVDSTWTRITYVVEDLNDTNYISNDGYAADYLRMISNKASAEGKFVFDNISVYYKNTKADVTVKANGNANVSDTVVSVDAVNGDTVGNIVAKVDTSASTKYLLGASLTAGGDLLAADYVIKASEVSEIYLIWGGDIVVDKDPWWEDGYGTLLFNVNWDGTLSSAAQTRWADVRAGGASTNPDWKNFEKLYFMWSDEDIGGTSWIPATSPLIVAEANGNRYYR